MRPHTRLVDARAPAARPLPSPHAARPGADDLEAFFYNAIFFTYALILSKFYRVPAEHIGWYIIPFALGNAFGPLLIGKLFDTVGRHGR